MPEIDVVGNFKVYVRSLGPVLAERVSRLSSRELTQFGAFSRETIRHAQSFSWNILSIIVGSVFQLRPGTNIALNFDILNSLSIHQVHMPLSGAYQFRT